MESLLVTGGNGGIGRAVVKYFAERGYFVFSLDIKLPETQLENVCDIACDITSEDSVQNAFEEVKSKTEKLAAVINLAGIYRMHSLIEMPFAEFKRAYDINFFGACLINKTFFPLYRNSGKVIITTSELAPQKIIPFNSIYMLTKSALDKYAQGLRAELSLLGVKVVTVRPGAIKTDMINKSNEEMYRLCENSELYKGNTKKFYKIMNGISSKSTTPEKLAKLYFKIVRKKHVKNYYGINHGFLLGLFSSFSENFRNRLLRWVLK